MRRFSSSSTTSRRAPSGVTEGVLAFAPGSSLRSCIVENGIIIQNLAPKLFSLFFVENWRINHQNNREGRAPPLFARDLNATAVLSHDVLRHPETQARPLLPRREERLEDARQIVFADAEARIANLNDNRRL